jgi:hypothetical protein
MDSLRRITLAERRRCLPQIIGVDDVRARYGLRDKAAARRLMRRAGGFVVAGRLMVRVDDLDAFERAAANASRSNASADRRCEARTTARRVSAPTETTPLNIDWLKTTDQKAA